MCKSSVNPALEGIQAFAILRYAMVHSIMIESPGVIRSSLAEHKIFGFHFKIHDLSFNCYEKVISCSVLVLEELVLDVCNNRWTKYKVSV